MDADFWKERWATGRIGFHSPTIHPLLAEHLHTFQAGWRVLVPLCGKSVDMAALAQQGCEIWGIELVHEAIEAFFAEHQLSPEAFELGPFKGLRAAGVTLLSGDFFAATPELLGTFDALYDRAALVALPPELRPLYAQTCSALLAPQAEGALITFEYPAHTFQGPPFSIPLDEVRTLYPHAEVCPLHHREVEISEGMRQAGMVALAERLIALR